jgi:hypothetical protein
MQINQIFKKKHPACCDVWWPTVKGIFFQIYEPFGGLVSVWPRKMAPLAVTFLVQKNEDNIHNIVRLCFGRILLNEALYKNQLSQMIYYSHFSWQTTPANIVL